MTELPLPSLKSLMTPFPYQVDSGESIQQARDLMKQHDIHHLLVNHGDDFSLVSERDIQHHALLAGSHYDSDLSIGDLCADRMVCADINDPVDRVLDAMATQHLGSIVVLREGELAGIITTTDACRHFAELLRAIIGQQSPPDIVA